MLECLHYYQKIKIDFFIKLYYYTVENMPKKQLKGIIISDKMQKTAVVKVEKLKEHSKYKRRFKVSKKYKAHDEKKEYKVGDNVIIEECKPLSKDKRWIIIKKF